MPKFNCCYAYDTPCYFDVTIEAVDEAEAKATMEEALKNGRFESCVGSRCYINTRENKRVFVCGPAHEKDEVDDLDNLK